MGEIKTFYNVNGEKRVFTVEPKPVGSGTSGFVQLCSSGVLLKEYYDACDNNYKLKLSIYQIIQMITSRHIMEIYDFLYKGDHVFGFDEAADAYTCHYIKPTIGNILYVPTQYMLENMYELILLAEIFAKKKVLLHDLNSDNIILTENNMVLIDPDRWSVSYLINEYEIRKFNINEVLEMFVDICDTLIEKDNMEELESCFYYNVVEQLFQISEKQIEDNEDVTQIINQRLKGYKYPIDYIKKYEKNRRNLVYF